MARKIALITGATSGIGEGCARRFAQGGYNLIITGRNTGKLEILKQELEEEGVQVLALIKTTPRNSSLLFYRRKPAEWNHSYCIYQKIR